MEKWKQVLNYEGCYEVSDLGRIKSLDRKVSTGIKHNNKRLIKGRVLKQNLKRDGYLSVDLSKEGKVKTIPVHKAVAITFIPNPNNKPCVNHKNGNKQDNRVINLEWCTYKENSQHAVNTGLIKPFKKQIMCVEENKIFDSSVEAAKWLNKTKYNHTKSIKTLSKNIRRVCTGQRKSCSGYKWKDLV